MGLTDPHESDQPHRGIRSTFKTSTTPDVTEGIKLAIQGAISKSGIPLESISSVMIGTTVRLLRMPTVKPDLVHD